MLSRKQIRNIVPSDFLFHQVRRLKTYLEDPLEGSQQKERGNKRKRRQQEAIEEEKKTETKENSAKKFRIGGRKEIVCPENEKKNACEIKKGEVTVLIFEKKLGRKKN